MEAMTSARGEKPERAAQDKAEAEEEAANAAAAPTTDKAAVKEEAEIVDIEELLFKQNHIDYNFEATEIFLEPKISYGLYSHKYMDPFALRPWELYDKVRQLAEKRYSYKLLPPTLFELKCLSTPGNKFSVLRDLCLCVGLKLNLQGDSELLLENDSTKLRQLVSAKLQYQRNSQNQKQQQKKKQQNQQQQLVLVSDEELYTYANMPFHRGLIADFFPIVKHLNYQNQDASQMMQEAIAASNEGQFEKAFDLYN